MWSTSLVPYGGSSWLSRHRARRSWTVPGSPGTGLPSWPAKGCCCFSNIPVTLSCLVPPGRPPSWRSLAWLGDLSLVKYCV